MIKNKVGLEEALAASLVETLIRLLGKDRPPEVQREACVTLTLACFDDMAKIIAIQARTGWLYKKGGIYVVGEKNQRHFPCVCLPLIMAYKLYYMKREKDPQKS